VKYAKELCEVLEKIDETLALVFLKDPDRLLFSQWTWGEGNFF
jgi:hypothetical protein